MVLYFSTKRIFRRGTTFPVSNLLANFVVGCVGVLPEGFFRVVSFNAASVVFVTFVTVD